jgi:hypothetical protein
MADTDLPAPLVPPEVDIRGTPLPHDMLVALAATIGRSEQDAVNMMASIGWVRVGDGWLQPTGGPDL